MLPLTASHSMEFTFSVRPSFDSSSLISLWRADEKKIKAVLKRRGTPDVLSDDALACEAKGCSSCSGSMSMQEVWQWFVSCCFPNDFCTQREKCYNASNAVCGSKLIVFLDFNNAPRYSKATQAIKTTVEEG